MLVKATTLSVPSSKRCWWRRRLYRYRHRKDVGEGDDFIGAVIEKMLVKATTLPSVPSSKRCWWRRRLYRYRHRIGGTRECFLLEEFLDKEPIETKMNEVRRKVEGLAILRSKQHRLKVLLDDIAQNHYHVQTIFKRLAYAEKQLSFTFKQLALEGLLSEEQLLNL